MMLQQDLTMFCFKRCSNEKLVEKKTNFSYPNIVTQVSSSVSAVPKDSLIVKMQNTGIKITKTVKESVIQ